MPDLHFEVAGAEPERYAAVPLLNFKLQISEPRPGPAGPTPIQSVALRCQIRIEPARRRYAPPEQEQLVDLFGTPDRWARTVKPLLWAHVNVNVPPFVGAAAVDLPVPCSFDFSVGATQYFHALQAGEIPLCFLFSGTIFYEGPDGRLQVAQISWEKEAYYRLPVAAWHALMGQYYPNGAWLCLRQDVFDRLKRFRGERGLTSWEQAMETLLAGSAAEVRP